MASSLALKPINPEQFGYRQAAHLLSRAGFGGSPHEIATLQTRGLDAAVNTIVDGSEEQKNDINHDFSADLIRPLSEEDQAKHAKALREGNTLEIERADLLRQRLRAKDRFQMQDMEHWWIRRMIATASPLQEKLTLMWHSHFACSYQVVQDSYILFLQNGLFRTHAKGSFANLLTAVVRDPAVLRTLSNEKNVKKHPNEHMARVLLEHYSLGQGSFTESDVRESARALTGYSVHDHRFQYRRQEHDDAPKSILSQRRNFDAEKLVAVLLQQRACKQRVCRLLYEQLVGDPDSLQSSPEAESVIQALAVLLGEHRYELAPVLKTLFKSEHFYHTAIMGRVIRSPVHLLVGTARLLKTPLREMKRISAFLTDSGQRLFEPPLPTGWAGGRHWISASTLCARQNLCVYLITGKLPRNRQWSVHEIQYDPMPLLENLHSRESTAVVDHFTGMLLNIPLAPARRQRLIEFLDQRSGVTRHSMIGLLLLITAMPEYQMC